MLDASKKGRIGDLELRKRREEKAALVAERVAKGLPPHGPRVRDHMGRMIKEGQALPERKRDARGLFIAA